MTDDRVALASQSAAPRESGFPHLRRGGSLWASVRAMLGAILGLLPHVMHHIGLLAGAALLTGVAGNAVLYVVGLALTIPLLRRLHARFASWLAPALAAVIFTVLFLVSALVIGPAISGSTAGQQPGAVPASTVPADPQPDRPSSTPDPHSGHH